MAAITAPVLNAILDNCNGYYLEVLATSGSGYGYGTRNAGWGAANKAALIGAAVLGCGDLQVQSQLSTPANNLIYATDAATQAAQDLSQLLWAVQMGIIGAQINSTIRNLDTYLTYLNTANSGSYWAALQHPAWVQLYTAWFLGNAPSPWNVYADDPGTGNGAAYTNYLEKLVVGTGLTAGDTIDSTKYAGGFPAITVAGITGSGVVTVTGTARDPANYQTVTAGYTWTVTASANTTYTLVPGGSNPAPTNSLILAVSSVAAAAGISAGTITVISQRPSGRPTEP